jgi:hypothetical protein
MSGICGVALIGCAEPGGNQLTELTGKEVRIEAEPQVINTSSTSQVRERVWTGKLVSADRSWVVIDNGGDLAAVNRDIILSVRGTGKSK